MPRHKPNKLHDELDALLDGRPVELTDELAPLVEAADALRAELATHQLDPGVADRHLERVLEGSATVVQMPCAASQRLGRRRRAAAVVLAAALVLAPGNHGVGGRPARAGHVPVQAGIEQLRIASGSGRPPRGARADPVADERDELEQLVKLEMSTRWSPR